MIFCKKCNGTNIKSRVNYSHGMKSRSTTSFTCQVCGSSEVESKTESGNRGKKKQW